MAKHSHLPKYNDLLNPLLKALHGQATVNSRRDPFSLVVVERMHCQGTVISFYVS
jgi:hypothetical protein